MVGTSEATKSEAIVRVSPLPLLHIMLRLSSLHYLPFLLFLRSLPHRANLSFLRLEGRLGAPSASIPERMRGHKIIAPANNLRHLRNLREIKNTAPASPAPRGGLGRGLRQGLSLCFFLNTEDAEFTEYHPAHTDNTEHRVAMDGCHGTCAPTSLVS